MSYPAARTQAGASWSPVIRSTALFSFSGLFVVRTLSDSLILPSAVSSALNFVVAALAVVLAFFISSRRGAPRGNGLVPAILALSLASFMFATTGFGLKVEIVSELVRLWSILGMAVLARTAVAEMGAILFATRLVHLGLPAIGLLVVGFVTRTPYLFSGAGRAFGTFQQTNSAASFVALYSCLVLYLLLRTGRKQFVVFLILALAGAASTLSLGGIVSLLAGLMVLLFGSGASARIKTLATTALLAVSTLAATSGVLTDRLRALETTVSIDQATSGQTTNSLDWRFYNWKRLLAIWQEQPLLGWGMGSTNEELQPIGKQPHSEYVRVLVEFGILGAAFCVALLLIAIFLIFRPQTSSWGRTLALSALMALLVNAIVSNTVSYVPTMYLFVAIWAVGAGTRADPAPMPALEREPINSNRLRM
jgi:O-antigen ligase